MDTIQDKNNGKEIDIFESFFRNVPSGCVILSPIDDGNDFIIKAFNNAAERIEKISSDDVVGKRITESFPGIKEFGLLSIMTEVYKTGKEKDFPIKEYKDNRISGWRENRIFKLKTGEVVAVYNDVTEQKKGEEKLRKNLEELERLNKMMVGRENKMIELKKQVDDLTKHLKECLDSK